MTVVLHIPVTLSWTPTEPIVKRGEKVAKNSLNWIFQQPFYRYWQLQKYNISSTNKHSTLEWGWT